MRSIEKINERFETAPRTSKKAVYIFLKVLSIVIFLMSLLLLIAVPIAGILGILISAFFFFYSKSALRDLQNNAFQELRKSNTEDVIMRHQENSNDDKVLETYDCNVTGVMINQDGIDRQSIIRKLKIGDKIMLIADPDNQYDDNAVKVYVSNGVQIGWLPRGSYEQLEVFDRLSKGEFVSAHASKIYALDHYPGNYGLIIDICLLVDEDEYDDDDDDEQHTTNQ